MKTLNYLQEGILKDDKNIVSSYIEELDLKTGNEEMLKAGEKFGFKTVEAYGKIYAWSAEIARVHGYARPDYLSRLLDRWEIQAPSIGWFRQSGGTRIREALGINEKDSRAILIDWTGFLIIGVKGEGDNADDVLAYLLQRERESRINTASVDQYKSEKLRMDRQEHDLKIIEKRLSILERKISILKKNNQSIPESLTIEYKMLLGVGYPVDAQGQMFTGQGDK
jgi:hypothetical protein